MEARRPPRLIAVSRRRSRPDGRLDDWLAMLADVAAPAVWIREKDLDDRDLFELVAAARRALPPATRLLVSERADVALAAGADGVHLASTGLPTAAVVERFGRRLLVGRSTHRVEEVAAARRDGADYVTVSPVWATPGKAAPIGLDGLAAATAVGLPVLALGGVTSERIGEAMAAGAWGAAGIRLCADRPRAQAAVAELRRLATAGQ